MTIVAEGSLEDGPPNPNCESWRKVVIQRKKGGEWTKVETGTTGPLDYGDGTGQPWGVYKSGIPDKTSKYRVVAKKRAVSGGSASGPSRRSSSTPTEAGPARPELGGSLAEPR